MAFVLGGTILLRNEGAAFPTAQPRSNAQWARLYGALPLSFEANQGQTDPQVNFLSRGRGYTLFLTGHEAVLTLKSGAAAAGGQKPGVATTVGAPAVAPTILRLQLLGAKAQAQVAGREELEGKANYFVGNDPSKWRRNVPLYAQVAYQGVYPGVDLVYYGTQGGELEYDFVVAPGADPNAIALGVDAAGQKDHSRLRIDSHGDLVIAAEDGDVRFHKPVVYQTAPASAHRQLVDGRYTLDAQNRVRFELGPYDHNRQLVIDPVLSYATYIGGSGGDVGYAIAVDSNLDAYIAGQSNSTNYPATDAYQSSTKGNGDAFVTKVDTSGTKLLYSTYLGGTGVDGATALALYAGSVIITGSTTSSDFPVVAPTGTTTTYPFQQTYGGNTDAFVAEIGTTGSTLYYSSYLGGSGLDIGLGVAVDSTGFAYVTGMTESKDFPTASPLQTNNAGSTDAFLTKVNYNGESLVYSTYLGGSQVDVGQAIQVDGTGVVYLAGYTYSTDFPLVTAYQSAAGGGADGFVAKVNAAGSAVTFSTYLGGSGDDRVYGLALDGSKNIYVAGATTSSNFPVTSGVLQTSLKGSSDAFVSKFLASNNSLSYSTYLGGTDFDQANGIAVTAAGVAYITGFTESSDFPTQNPIQSVLGLSNNQLCGTSPCADAFVTVLNASGTSDSTTFSTYLGGNGPDFGQAIALDSTGDPYITGSTSSTNFPATSPPSSTAVATPPYSASLTGTAGNAFVAKMDPGNNPNISMVPSSLAFGNDTLSVTSTVQDIQITNPSSVPLIISAVAMVASKTPFAVPNTCVGTIPAGGGTCTMQVTFTPDSVSSFTDQIQITDNAGGVAGTEHRITVTGSGVTAATAVTVAPTSLSFSSTVVGKVSAAQNVTITNTGSQTLNITSISTGSSGDFTQTNTCSAVANTLSPGASCSVSVFFSPTASGTRTATLSISDNASGSPQQVSLTGTGAAEFTLSYLSSTCGNNTSTNPTIIGTTQVSFCIVAKGDPSFTGGISLACSAGTTCAFGTNPVFIGSNSLMTVSGLTSTSTNPYNFTVTGKSGTQTSSVQVNLLFEDYTLTATPSVYTTQAGGVAKYTVLVNPLNGFDDQVLLACTNTSSSTFPPDATCVFSPSEPTLNGSSPTTVSLSIQTQKYVANSHALPRFPGGPLPPLLGGLLGLGALASLAMGRRRRGATRLSSGWLALRLAALSAILVLNLGLAACRPSTLVSSGTTSGNYTITISGTLVSETSVVRYTTINLAVTASQQ
jgi:hypothetical protein